MSIKDTCMIVNLQIGLWSGQRLDKEWTSDVTAEAGAASDAARVNKHLIPKEDLAKVQTCAGALRTHFYHGTLPWKDNGDRVLTTKMFEKFMLEHSNLKAQFVDEVEQFLEVGYPAAQAKAQFRMGDRFNPSDYPHVEDLRRRFYVNLDVDPVSDAKDFRVDLSADQEASLRGEIEEATNRRIQSAMTDVWRRLETAVSNYHARMTTQTEDGKKPRFKDATVDNLAEIIELLPMFNITGDKELERIGESVKDSLLGYSAGELRSDSVLRSSAAEEARKILEDMGGFMRAFQKAGA